MLILCPNNQCQRIVEIYKPYSGIYFRTACKFLTIKKTPKTLEGTDY